MELNVSVRLAIFGKMEFVAKPKSQFQNVFTIATLMEPNVFVMMDFSNCTQVSVLLALLSKLGMVKNVRSAKNVG